MLIRVVIGILGTSTLWSWLAKKSITTIIGSLLSENFSELKKKRQLIYYDKKRQYE